jgi:hypothetical protein
VVVVVTVELADVVEIVEVTLVVVPLPPPPSVWLSRPTIQPPATRITAAPSAPMRYTTGPTPFSVPPAIQLL